VSPFNTPSLKSSKNSSFIGSSLRIHSDIADMAAVLQGKKSNHRLKQFKLF
jgi:hypothetical protein